MSSLASDLKQLAGDSVLALFGRGVALGGGFLVHTLLVRNLDPETFGVLSLALTITSVGAGFAIIGMGQAVTRFISGSSSEQTSSYVVVGTVVAITGGLLITVGIYTYRDILGVFFAAPELGGVLQFLAVLIVIRPLEGVILGTVRGFEKTRWKVISNDILPFVINIPIFLYFVFRGDVLLGAIAFYLLQSLTRIVLLNFQLIRWGGWTFRPVLPKREQFSEMVWFAWPLAFESLVVVFLGSIDILMLGRFMSSQKVGFYRSIQPVAKLLIFLLQALTFIYLPIATRYFEQGSFDELDTIYKAATRWLTFATFPLFLFYLVLGDAFIQSLFTEEYVVAWPALAILSVGMYSRVVAGPNGTTIKAINRTREDLLASVAALVTNFVLNYFLIPRYGIVGAAAATTTGYVVYNLIDISIIHKYTGVSPFHWKLVKPLVPTTIVILGLDQIVALRHPSLIELFVIGVSFVVIHLGSILATSSFTAEDQELLSDIIRGPDQGQ
jgi:O-antigen/teichoic acid export membrane protein